MALCFTVSITNISAQDFERIDPLRHTKENIKLRKEEDVTGQTHLNFD